MIHYDSPHLPVGMYSAQIRSSRRWSVQRINSAQQGHSDLPPTTPNPDRLESRRTSTPLRHLSLTRNQASPRPRVLGMSVMSRACLRNRAGRSPNACSDSVL
jgi:hypothetical protein